MSIEPDCVISSDSFTKYGLNDRCRISKARVQEFLDEGLMSQDAVYSRYTEELSEKLISVKRSDQPAVVEDIRHSFRHLCDRTTEYLTQKEFKRLITEKLLSLGLYGSPDASELLFDICSSYAFFPFPKTYDGSGQLKIDKDGFLRAMCLLTLSPAPRHGPDFSAATHRCYSGNWGPHRGSYIALRGSDAGDFRRRLFRSLAIPDSDSTNHGTNIPVPRFMWYETVEEGSGAEEELSKQVVVTEDESELSIDIVDVLSECPPDSDTDIRTANPFRESYRILLPSLPQHTGDLSVLYIPTTRLVELVKLAQDIQQESTGDLVARIERLGSDGKVGWNTFDSAIAEHSELIADGLSKLFGILTVSEVEGSSQICAS